jgi:hypothetical protein
MTSVGDIVLGMEYHELTSIKVHPNYKTINTTHRKIYANASSVNSQRGCARGHLGQIMTRATYLMVTAMPYNNPPNHLPYSHSNGKKPRQRIREQWISSTHPTTLKRPSSSRSSRQFSIRFSLNQLRTTSEASHE